MGIYSYSIGSTSWDAQLAGYSSSMGGIGARTQALPDRKWGLSERGICMGTDIGTGSAGSNTFIGSCMNLC